MDFLNIFHHNKKVSIGLCLLLLILSIPGLFYFQLSVDYRVFFNKKSAEVKIFNEFEATYGKSDFYILALETSSETIYETKFLQVLLETSHWTSKIPYSTRVESLINYLPIKNTITNTPKQNKTSQNDWILSDKEIQKLKTHIHQDTSIINRLVSKDEKMTAIWINIHVPKDTPNAVLESSNFIDKKIQDLHSLHPEISFYVSGVSKMNSTFADYVFKDLKLIVPLSFIFIFISLFLLLGNLWMAAGILVTNLMASISAIGLGSYLGIPLTTPSSMAPTIILTLTVADCLHLALGALKRSSSNQVWGEVIRKSLSVHFRPIFLTSLTTLIGFLCLNLSESPPYRDLGNLTAIGVFFAFVYSILFYPVWLSIKKPKRKTILHQGNWQNFTVFIIKNTKAILISSVGLLIASCFFIFHLESDDIFISWFSKETKFRQDTEKISSNLTGIYTLEYHIKGDHYTEGIFSPEYLSNIHDFTQWWKDKLETRQIYSFLNIIESFTPHPPNKGKQNKSDHLKYTNIQQILQHQKKNLEDSDLNHRVSEKQNSTRLTVILKEVTGKEIREISKEADKWVENNMNHSSAKTTGPTLLFANISLKNIKGMIQGFSLGILLITLILWFEFRSIRLVTTSIITNTLPILLALGLWYFLYGMVDLAVSIVGPVTFGIIVDDTIHFLCNFCKNKKISGDTEKAVQATLEEVGPTLIASTLTLNIGFATLMFSQFLLNDTLGLLSLIIISTALLFDLIVLPAILIFLNPEKEKFI